VWEVKNQKKKRQKIKNIFNKIANYLKISDKKSKKYLVCLLVVVVSLY
jgi:hypothetical protein